MYLKLEERESQIILERDYMFNKVKGQVTKVVQQTFNQVEEHAFFSNKGNRRVYLVWKSSIPRSRGTTYPYLDAICKNALSILARKKFFQKGNAKHFPLLLSKI
jgi:hypothetical protein